MEQRKLTSIFSQASSKKKNELLASVLISKTYIGSRSFLFFLYIWSPASSANIDKAAKQKNDTHFSDEYISVSISIVVMSSPRLMLYPPDMLRSMVLLRRREEIIGWNHSTGRVRWKIYSLTHDSTNNKCRLFQLEKSFFNYHPNKVVLTWS